MARLQNTPDSYAPFLVELLLEGDAGQPDLRIPTETYLRSLEAEETTEAAWVGSVVLFDPDGGFLESELTARPVGHRKLKLRWGWDQSGHSVSDFPLFYGQVVKWESTFNEQGVELTLELLAIPVIEAVTDKRVWSFPEGKKVSEIVTEIATTLDWKTADAQGNSTIEATDQTLDKPIQNYDESAVKMIRDQLLPLAANADGEAFSFYISRDNTVHFHSRGFMLKADARPTVAASYTFARDTQGDVISFSPRNTSIFAMIGGSENAVYTFYDERTGRRIEIETTKDGGPDNLIVSYPDEKAVTDAGDGVKARIPIPARSEAEGRQMVRSRYAFKRELAYEASLEVRGTHAVWVGDFIEVNYFIKDGSKHYLSGIFRVIKVQHALQAGNWTTEFELQRAGQSIAGEQTGALKTSEQINADKKRPIQTRSKVGQQAQGNRDERRARIEERKQTRVR